MKTRIQAQSGLTMLAWLLVMAVAGVAFLCVVKIGPVYVESMTVRSILNQLNTEARAENLGKSEIYRRMEKRLFVNAVKGLDMKEVVIKHAGRGIEIDANYEVRKHLMFNLDFVVAFDDMIVNTQSS